METVMDEATIFLMMMMNFLREKVVGEKKRVG